MAQDPQLSNLLKWAVENSTEDANAADPSGAKLRAAAPNPEALAALFGGKSDADLMRETMAAIQHAEVNLPNKLVAFDNFEQLVESIDNANNLEPLKLWAPLIALLADPEAEMRMMAAWCIGTAVQNNPAAQQRALDHSALEPLVALVQNEKDRAAQRKACYAISSEVRNFQPGLDHVLRLLGREAIDATDMEKIDALLQELRME